MVRSGMRFFVGLAMVALVAGCGQSGQDANRPKTVPVKGTVSYNGSPVEGATVTFSPASGSTGGRGAVGRTDASGAYTLTTLESGDGAIAGSYSVAISKTQVEGALSEEETNKYYAEGKTPPEPTMKELLPAKYKDAKKSGLTADVAEGKDNVFDFSLTD